jgi:hypothetical protein
MGLIKVKYILDAFKSSKMNSITFLNVKIQNYFF